MIKKIITLLVIVFTVTLQGQENKQSKSKMSDFVSQTGTIIKYENYDLPKLKSAYGSVDVKVQKIMSGNLTKYFYLLSKPAKYSSKTASIAYEDLIEVMKALDELQKQLKDDLNTTSDYLENKFVTDDKFMIGYYVSKGKSVWYLKLDSYGNDNTVFIKDIELFSTSFKLGKEKIEELKQ
ncbi:hypothetical protein [Pseudotenacibaculum haliotis]|uniref:Uncharacterized protein n=1 Tax=Pseudotenacibaculum haliotis TaxID=1862138 RepID=A0ABW5LWY3_9FLAO